MIKKCKWGQIKCLHRWREAKKRRRLFELFFISPALLWYFFCVVLPRVYDLFAECGRNDINLTVWPKETINPTSSKLTSLNITQTQSPKYSYLLNFPAKNQHWNQLKARLFFGANIIQWVKFWLSAHRDICWLSLIWSVGCNLFSGSKKTSRRRSIIADVSLIWCGFRRSCINCCQVCICHIAFLQVLLSFSV